MQCKPSSCSDKQRRKNARRSHRALTSTPSHAFAAHSRTTSAMRQRRARLQKTSLPGNDGSNSPRSSTLT
eukprot:2099874-Pleurochrysis_carterae.AAC.1